MAMKKKPNLKKALNKIDKSNNANFGAIDVDLESLPCLKKVHKEKITANFDADLLEAVRSFAKERNVSYTSVMNDVLRKVFIDEDKAG